MLRDVNYIEGKLYYSGNDEYQQDIITHDDVYTIQAIPNKSINDFTSEEIGKTTKWAVKFWRELKTKSSYFRAQLGDWRAYDKRPVKIFAVTGTSDDMRRSTYRNDDTGWDILVSKRVLGETKAHAKRGRQVFIDAQGNIEDIVKNAILLDTVTRQTPKTQIQAYNKSSTVFMHSLYTIITWPYS